MKNTENAQNNEELIKSKDRFAGMILTHPKDNSWKSALILVDTS
jgi:hypothetical protein